MEYILWFVDFFLHLDQHLDALIQAQGSWSYIILCTIIFCETGLVVTPILPGDSLLFAAGTFAARGSLSISILLPALFLAAITGNTVNYHIGHFLGDKAFENYPRIFKRKYLEKTERFYEKYGAKTIIFAQFVPIVRSFAPFMAGVGTMKYPRFALFNITGAALWMSIMLGGGYFFGNIEIVKRNFTLVILAIIFVSILPAIIEGVKSRLEAKALSQG